jgi:hypothetical protein
MPLHDVKLLGKEYVKKYCIKNKYTYNAKEYLFYVYRITVYNNGVFTDLTQDEINIFCEERNLLTPKILKQFIYDGDINTLENIVRELSENQQNMSQSYMDKHILEGIIIRVDTEVKTLFYKSKSFVFKVMEGHEESLSREEIL